MRQLYLSQSQAGQWMAFAGRLSGQRMLLTIMALNALVALTGFAKDVAIAGLLGTSALADAFAATYFIVDTVGNNVLGNAVNVAAATHFGASTVPVVDASAELTNSRGDSLAAWRVVRGVGVVSLLLAAVLWSVHQPFLRLYILNTSQLGIASSMYLWLLPSILFYPCYYALAGALQAIGRFRASVGAPILLNLLVLGVAVWESHRTHVGRGDVLLLCAAVSVGALWMLLCVVWAWRKSHSELDKPRTVATKLDFSVKTTYTRLVTISLSYSIYLSFVQGVGFAERFAAARLGPGSLAALGYAYRVAQVPNWVFVSALGTFLLPKLAAAVKSQRSDVVTQMLGQAVETCLMLCLPVAIVFFVLRGPLIHVLFERGAFSHHSAVLTAKFVGSYAIAEVLQALSVLLFRLAAATGRLSIPVLVTGTGAAVNAFVDVVFTPQFGPFTIGVGAAIGSGLAVVGLANFLHRQSGFVRWPRWQTITRYGFANLSVLVLSAAAGRIVGGSTSAFSTGVLVGVLSVAAIVIIIVYFTILQGLQRWGVKPSEAA